MPGTSQNFNPPRIGECQVYGVAYQGDLNADKNMLIADLSAIECMERYENYIVVNRVDDSITSIGESSRQSNALNVVTNPAKDQVQVDINSQEKAQAQLKVIGVSGQTLIQENLTLQNGNNKVSLSLNETMKGTYILSLQRADQIDHQKLLVK